MAHDVFISYSTKDKTVADALCATIEARGIPCWIAPRNIAYGSDYGEAIVDGINESRVMVLVFSSNANTSPHIKREVDRAVSKGLTIIPIRIEDVAPTRALEYYISPVHWLDAVTPPIEGHLHALAEKIEALLGQGAPAAAHVAAPAPAAIATSPTPAAPAPERVASAPPARRFGLGAGIGGTLAVVALAAVLWAQPWNPDKAAEKAKEAAQQAQLEAQQRREEATRRAEQTGRAEEAARRAEEAARRLEEARKADEARRARPAEEPKRAPDMPVQRVNPGPVARVDPAATKATVEQTLREYGLLKQSGADRWGVSVEITGAGVVTLTGVLRNDQQRSDTVRLAGAVPGVSEVRQRINVQQSWNTR